MQINLKKSTFDFFSSSSITAGVGVDFEGAAWSALPSFCRTVTTLDATAAAAAHLRHAHSRDRESGDDTVEYPWRETPISHRVHYSSKLKKNNELGSFPLLSSLPVLPARGTHLLGHTCRWHTQLSSTFFIYCYPRTRCENPTPEFYLWSYSCSSIKFIICGRHGWIMRRRKWFKKVRLIQSTSYSIISWETVTWEKW